MLNQPEFAGISLLRNRTPKISPKLIPGGKFSINYHDLSLLLRFSGPRNDKIEAEFGHY